MKINELRQQLEEKKVEARGLLETDLAKAEKIMEEVRGLQKKISLYEEIEAEEKRDLENQRRKNERKREDNMAVNEMRAITKKLMGVEMTEEERAAIKTSDNAALVPKEFVNKLQEIKKGYGSLKEYCDVITVTKNSGTIPVVDLDQNTKLGDVTEGDVIADGTLVTTEIAFTCKKVGLIQTLSSELVEDAEIEIEGLVNKNFAELATTTENEGIIKVLKDNATAVDAPTDYSDIQNAMDTVVPAARAGVVCYTNINGFAYLKNLKDSQKRPLNLVTEINGKYYFNGKELIPVDMQGTTPEKKFFIVANTKEAVKFIERKGVSIARSTEAGFTSDTVKLRILERIAVVLGNKRSIKSIEL